MNKTFVTAKHKYYKNYNYKTVHILTNENLMCLNRKYNVNSTEFDNNFCHTKPKYSFFHNSWIRVNHVYTTATTKVYTLYRNTLIMGDLLNKPF